MTALKRLPHKRAATLAKARAEIKALRDAGCFEDDDTLTPVLALPDARELPSPLDYATTVIESCTTGASGCATLYGDHIERELKRTGRTLNDLQMRHEYYDPDIDVALEAAIDFGLRCVFATQRGGRSASTFASRKSSTLIGRDPLRGTASGESW